MNENGDKYISNKLEIPREIRENWSRIVNLLAEMQGMTAGFITRVNQDKLKILKTGQKQEIEIAEGETIELDEVYCRETVVREEMVEINNARQLEEWQDSQDFKMGFISYLGIPIFDPGEQKIFGTICVAGSSPHEFTAQEKNLLYEFKLSIENQLNNILLNHELKNQKAKIKKLQELTFDLQNTGSEAEILPKIYQAAREILGFNFCNISLIQDDKLVTKISTGEAEEVERKLSEKSIAAKTFKENRSFLLTDIQNNPEAAPLKNYYNSGISVPMGKLGVFQAISEKKNAFSDNDLELAELLTAHATAALEKIYFAERLKQEKERLESLFYNLPDAIITIDMEASILAVNEKFEHLFKYKQEDIKGENVDAVLRIANRENSVEESWTDKLLQGEQISAEVTRYTKNGSSIEVFIKTVPITVNDKVMGGYIIYEDISKRKKKEQELKFKTYHDELTGLYNRKYFSRKIKNLDRYKQLPISIIMVDINGLKIINDTFGHDKGDEVLKKAAKILNSVIRDNDILVRYGGDEFVIVLPQTSNEIAHDVLERIEEKSRATINNELPVALGMGVSTKSNPAQDINKALKKADDSMLQDKLVSEKSRKNRMVKGLLNTLGAKSDETKEHAMRMTELAHNLGQKIGVTNSDLNKLSLLATLHDIGKTSIPEEILTKPGDLTEEEWRIIKKHPKRGYKIASASEEFAPVADYILAHHEHWDGSGYPQGLQGEEIPLMARIISIVDAYDVMTSGRPYKKAMTKEETLKEISNCAGGQFDPGLAEKFAEMMCA